MSAFMVSNETIDLIVQAAFKYKVVTKRQRTLFGQTLWQANQQSLSERYSDEGEPTYLLAADAYPAFTPFPRKVKRIAISGALACFEYQSCEAAGWATSEVKRLLDIVAEKNAMASGYEPTTQWTPTLTPEGEIVTVDEERYDDDDEPYMEAVQQGENTILASAAVAMRAATRPTGGVRDVHFWNIRPEQRDPESEDYTASVMVRPIEVIRAERAVERDRIMAERAAYDTPGAVAVNDDADEEEWDDGDDDLT
jgi:hypothetical protein